MTQFWPDYLTQLGYVTLTVDSLGSRGLPPCRAEYLRQVEEWTRDAYGALDYLAGSPAVARTRIGVMGFSLGALTVNYFAGRGITSPRGHTFRAALSFCPITVHMLPGVYHAFDRPEMAPLRYDVVGSPMLYSAAATKHAQEITREFLARHLGRPS